jgi:uncharacterized protein
MTSETEILGLLTRIADALERTAPPAPAPADFTGADAFVWSAEDGGRFQPVPKVNRVPLGLLKGIDHTASILLENTRRFAAGLPANNALLWGARGMGKSSLVKAAHAEASRITSPPLGEVARSAGGEKSRSSETPRRSPNPSPSLQGAGGLLILVEIHREDIASLPHCLAHLKCSPHRFIVFCDDLSFDKDDTSYKSLKAVLEGGIEGRPSNVLFYATSNRRHLMPRDMVENERSTAINPSEAVEEKVSLSDRFGLWLGFHNASQDDYLAMVRAYVQHYGLNADAKALEREALEWATTRGARSGRVAWQFIQDLAGRLGSALD